MGVPGVFAYLLKNYKKQILTTDNQIIDELYLDSNCFIHPCCFKVLGENPNWKNINQLEKLMIESIISYLDYIITFSNPQKLIYIAIDGVAPMTKIKHQRQRRFKSVVDYNETKEIYEKYQQPVSNFWSNASITPGTEFMSKITKAIMEYIKEKIKVKVIFSSAQSPGEGEHKIMSYIRKRKTIKNIAIYGLDADLIFLSLATNKPNIFLLREYKEISKDQKEPFVWVSIDSLKDCVKESFKEHGLEKENVIQDFIFLCYLLGNDFIPHLPSLSIYDKGIDIILETYAQKCKEINIIEVGNKITINYQALMEVLHEFSLHEDKYFRKQYHKKQHDNIHTPAGTPLEIELWKRDNLKIKLDDPVELGKDFSKSWKPRYYQHYYESNTPGTVLTACQKYFEGLEWIANYYFSDCISWTWYYPFDHAPFVSDLHYFLKNRKMREIKFKKEKPVEPIVQLMMVLPKALDFLIPKYYRTLICTALQSFYPESFPIDHLNMKKHWQGIAMLPNINIDVFKHVISQYTKTVREKKLIECEYLDTINIKISEYKFN